MPGMLDISTASITATDASSDIDAHSTDDILHNDVAVGTQMSTNSLESAIMVYFVPDDFTGFDYLSRLYGPLVGGPAFAMFLYGVTCAQTMYYFWHYARDRLWMKSLVVMLWALDTVIGLLDVMILYSYFIYELNFSSAPSSAQFAVDTNVTGVSFWLEFILSSIVVIIVHSYYVYAIWTSSTRTWYHRPLTLVLLLLAIGSLVAGLANAAFAIRDGNETIPGYGTPYRNPDMLTYSLSTIPAMAQMFLASITDIGITVTLCLSTIRQKHSIFRADPMLIKLSRYLIERAILTTTIQLLQMATYVYAEPWKSNANNPRRDSYLWTAFQIVGSKIYVNSFLALLNARNHLREAGEIRELRVEHVKTETCSPTESSHGARSDPVARDHSERHRIGDGHSSWLSAGSADPSGDGGSSGSIMIIE